MTSRAVPHNGPDSGSTESWLVAAGRDRRPGSPLNLPPIPASNFVLGERRAYSRDDGTPSWEAFEEIVGGLERGSAVAFASGMVERQVQKYNPNPTVGPCALSFRVRSRFATESE